jgi:hypothetical protein
VQLFLVFRALVDKEKPVLLQPATVGLTCPWRRGNAGLLEKQVTLMGHISSACVHGFSLIPSTGMKMTVFWDLAPL